MVVLGYPTGVEALLAKADGSVVRQILLESVRQAVTESLGKAGLIRPSATQGHIGDVTRTDVVFDAPTTQGGSGGPVLNRSGQVIAVEYAVLTSFVGSSFGVPIGHALELLEPADRGDDSKESRPGPDRVLRAEARRRRPKGGLARPPK